MSEKQFRPETTSEHIARDMREGRFPEQSPVQMVPVEAPAHAEPVARVNMADWSDLPDVYVTKAECQQGMFWRIEACSVPMAIGPEVRLIRADKMLAHPPTDAAEIEQLRYIAAANQDRAEKAEAERDAALARAEKAEAERDRWEDACHIAQQKYFEMVAERDAALARVAELEAALTPLPDAELDALRDEAYDATEKAARYYGPNGYIAHTWTKKSAFFAGWDAALRIRPVPAVREPTALEVSAKKQTSSAGRWFGKSTRKSTLAISPRPSTRPKPTTRPPTSYSGSSRGSTSRSTTRRHATTSSSLTSLSRRPPMSTTYTTLRRANEVRQLEWDGNGHAMNDDWRMNELMGETGEVCNVLKKLHRERAGVPGSRADKEMLADEIADIVICLDLFLMTKGIGPSAPVMMFVNGDTLTANGRKLFSAVARLDTLAQFDDHDDILKAATDIHSRCLTLAATEGIDLHLAVAKKFNETTRKMGLTTFLHVPD